MTNRMDNAADDLARLADRLDKMMQRLAVLAVTRSELSGEVTELEQVIHDLNNLRMTAQNWRLRAEINGYEPED